MHDVAKCKEAIEYLAENTNNKLCSLLLRKWNILKELILLLQVPYKATIALQLQSLTLSDAYGIWEKMINLLDSVEMRRICKTDFRLCLYDAINNRKKNCENAIMWAALFLDPRHRHHVAQNEAKTSAAIELLKELWQKILSLRVNDQERYIIFFYLNNFILMLNFIEF